MQRVLKVKAQSNKGNFLWYTDFVYADWPITNEDAFFWRPRFFVFSANLIRLAITNRKALTFAQSLNQAPGRFLTEVKLIV